MTASQRFIGAAVFLTVVLLFALFPAVPIANRVESVVDIGMPERLPMQLADFGRAQPTDDARTVADRIAGMNDNEGADFIIIDKKDARLYVFDGSAHLRAFSTVLIGAALGDDMASDIGKRAFNAIHSDEKTTPAGRFLAERGHDSHGQDVIWVDYDAAVAIHRVLTANPGEHRLQRLASEETAAKRISLGCINVPVAFYESYLRPMFAQRKHLVYILPDTRSVDQVFGTDLQLARRG
jgi:hypothetical protein